MANERARQKRNYVPSDQLTESARKKRNKETAKRLRKHRRAWRENSSNTSGQPPDNASGSGAQQPRMLVRLRSIDVTLARKRRKNQRSKENVIKRLREKNDSLQRRLKTTQKRLQRLNSPPNATPETPRRATDAFIRSMGLQQKITSRARKQLLFRNVLIRELRSKTQKSDSSRKAVFKAVTGRIIAKYRCKTLLSQEIGMNRNRVSKIIKDGIDFSKKRRRRVREKEKQKVVAFLERDDNSRMQPGKRDTTKTDGVKVQTRVLTDYLGNLFEKYCSENVESKLSLATFCRLRPNYIQLSSFLRRSVCLCTKHQNFALKLQALKREGIVETTNPDAFIKNHPNIEKSVLPEKITFSKWKKVTIEGQKKKMKIVSEELGKDDFHKLWENEVTAFRRHSSIMKTQFLQGRILKENLPLHEIIIHMDFAENYSCKSAEEIQSAYWNSSQVTLHPMVVYYRDLESGDLRHQSFVAISDELSHSSSTVLAILDHFFRDELDLPGCNEVQYVHYWTDSPTSQYRNRYIFDAISRHGDLFGCPATWNYFEAGHGKSVCDGLGGTVKRMADDAVRTCKFLIQDTEDFYQWARKSNLTEVRFFFVQKEECQTKLQTLEDIDFPTVKGTLKLHSVKKCGGVLLTRDVSCYCDICMTGMACDEWSSISSSRDGRAKDDDVRGDDEPNTNPSDPIRIHPKEGDYVAAIYEGKWFVGKVLDADETDGELQITFMETKKFNMFQWPNREDVLWTAPEDILCVLAPPIATGRRKRLFALQKCEYQSIEELYADWKRKNSK